MPNYSDVPLMFQAQIEGRCQLQRVEKQGDESQVYAWIKEWTKYYPQTESTQPQRKSPQLNNIHPWKVRPPNPKNSPIRENIIIEPPSFGKDGKTKDYHDFIISWRLVTNGGQDDSIIRPTIGAKGYPYYSGSSMKGAFRRACNNQQEQHYCGKKSIGDKGSEPGILRFHGGYPINNCWTENLVDIVHSQQEKQVIKDQKTNANTQISLHQVTLRFGISSNISLEQAEWDTIWEIWKKALGQGLGSRVSAGYGRFEGISQPDELLTVHLKGQGLYPQLLNKTHEFRPNMFKAALRGHTLRLLGGMTDDKTAKYLTTLLWGGIDGKAEIGELGVWFDCEKLKPREHYYTPPGKKEQKMPIYHLEKGTLSIFLMNLQASLEERRELTELAKALIQFSLLFGGFGKSWRRVDHKIFFKDYFSKQDKPYIGCHWQFIQDSTSLYLPINNLSDFEQLW